MSHSNSRVYASINLSIDADIPQELKITQDGILDMFPLQWSDTDIPFVITVNGSCDNFMPYVSADFVVSSDLYSFCVVLSTEGYEGIFDGLQYYCDSGLGYYKGTFNIPGSALPDPTEEWITDPCDPENQTRIRKRRQAIDAMIYATATVQTPNLSTYELTGESTKFQIVKKNNFYDFRKINEDKTLVNFLKEFNLTQWTINNTTDDLFDTYLKSMLGNDEPSQINTQMIEKVRNYFSNNYDIDTCNIPSLYSNAELVGESLELDLIRFPSEIERIMNLISIPHTTIFGKVFNPKINLITGTLNYNSIGKYLTETIVKSDIITEAKQIVYNQRNTDLYKAIYLDDNDIGLTYNQSLSAYFENAEDYGIEDTCMYDIEWPDDEKSDNILDYANEDNKLDYMDYSEWIRQAGVVEEMLQYVLRKNLE